MKKIMLFASALAGLFFAASCQQENLEPVMSGNTVTYTVQVPEALATKTTIGDEVSNVNKLHYEVYRTSVANTTTFSDVDRLLYHKTADVTDGVATIEVELVNDQNFTVLFWAQVEKDGFDSPYVVNDLTNVRIKTDAELSLGKAHKANQEDYAAFTGVDFIKSTDKLATKTVELTRPVAQLNIGTTYESLNAFKTRIEVEGSSVNVSGLSKTFDVANQAASGEFTATFKYTETAAPSEPLKVNDKEYKYVGMNYVGFADEVDNTLITVSYVINTTEGNIDNTIENVPVKPNYRTNIIGNLITSKTDYIIELIDTWGDPENVYSIWDGESVTEPEVEVIEGEPTYVVESASDLAWLAAAVNGTLPAPPTTFATRANNEDTYNFVLTSDIDLNNMPWTPIGTKANPYKGTFDGNGKTIANLFVDGGTTSDLGFFGYTTSGEIKNLTIENAKVSGRLNVGVVAGTPYTSKYTNITVKGHVEVNGMAYVGGVAGKNAYADWTNVTVNVDETSYVNANSIENGTAYRSYVGGVVGFNGEGGHTFKNITSNIDVKGSTIDAGGLFGIAHYGNKFVNCKCSGNVEIYAAEEAGDAEEIGGIAGVWHNQSENTVSFTNCLFEGTLKTNIPSVDLVDNRLTGAAYSATGTGVLVVDGKNYYDNLASIVAALDNEDGYVTLFRDVKAEAASSNGYGKTGVKLHKGGTLDGNGHTLTITGAGTTWDSAISTTGGTIKNITVAGAMRGIFMPGASADVNISNVTFKNVIYTFNSDAGNKEYGVYLSNCTINGWTSHSDVHKEVVYTDCSFGAGSGYKFCRPYGPTTYKNCEFCEGYEIDARGKVVFENCRVNGVDVTKANFTQLVTGNPQNVSWLKPTFADNSWEDIIGACQYNSIPDTWVVGDKKTMTIGGSEYQIAIIGKNHDVYTAGGKAPLTFQIAEIYGTTAKMNKTQTNTTGWSGSAMRTDTMPAILSAMPSEVQKAIKEVNKETLNGTRDGLETTSDKLFLLSEIEVNGSVYFSNNFEEGARYAYYTDLNSQIMNSNGKPATWWLRGPGKSNAIGFTQINASGYMANGSAEYAAGVIFGFCF